MIDDVNAHPYKVGSTPFDPLEGTETPLGAIRRQRVERSTPFDPLEGTETGYMPGGGQGQKPVPPHLTR